MAEDKEKGSGIKPEPKTECTTPSTPTKTTSPTTTPPTSTPPFLAWPPLLLHPWAPALLPGAWCSSAALRSAFPGLVAFLFKSIQTRHVS